MMYEDSITRLHDTLSAIKNDAARIKKHISLLEMKCNADLKVADEKVSEVFGEQVRQSAAVVDELRKTLLN